jgi:RNA polymerase sigma-70 factor, ECF subfamily
MGRKHCLAGELWLDHQLLRTMEGASSPKQKVSEIFDLLQHPVYRYLFRLLGDPGEAEDLEQECFLRLYICLHKSYAVKNVRAWIFRVAHNLAINHQKRNVLLDVVDPDVLDLNKDQSPDPEQKALAKEKHERLQAYLVRLSVQERQCLELRAKGLCYREIAKVMGMHLPTVVSFLGRVIRTIGREIHD